MSLFSSRAQSIGWGSSDLGLAAPNSWPIQIIGMPGDVSSSAVASFTRRNAASPNVCESSAICLRMRSWSWLPT